MNKSFDFLVLRSVKVSYNPIDFLSKLKADLQNFDGPVTFFVIWTRILFFCLDYVNTGYGLKVVV